MAEIKVAKSAGFCFGVDRAVKALFTVNLKRAIKVLQTLGPIIHNADVGKRPYRQGRQNTDSVDKEGEKLLFILTKIFSGTNMLDATCPFVARIHKIVREKTEEGYFILIAGDKDHPEVQGNCWSLRRKLLCF